MNGCRTADTQVAANAQRTGHIQRATNGCAAALRRNVHPEGRSQDEATPDDHRRSLHIRTVFPFERTRV
jgi:hypothetical protein